ncbi:Cyclin-A2-1 [Platanthera guangdongensis]|uniref:Cyclin-A2-1 n=1 Tax=Platanthera guangdongensis TaxID=2320717 RepID=A0ABR2LDN0_9ASPA
MRGILVDWLVEVTEEYKLVVDSLFLVIPDHECTNGVKEFKEQMTQRGTKIHDHSAFQASREMTSREDLGFNMTTLLKKHKAFCRGEVLFVEKFVEYRRLITMYFDELRVDWEKTRKIRRISPRISDEFIDYDWVVR